MELRRILVPVDFSEGSRVALRRALATASDAEAGLIVLHAFGPRPEVPGPLLEAVEREAGAALGELGRELEGTGVAFETRLHPGSPLEAVEEVEDEVTPDLIVVGARGHSALRRAWVGSVADAIVRHAHAPVLVAREAEEGTARPLARILVATDFSPHASEALVAARKLAAHDAALHVAHVLEVPYEDVAKHGSHAIDEARARAKEQLDRIAHDSGAVAHALEGSPPHQVVRLAEQLDCDLIACGTRGTSRESWLLAGSVASKVIRLFGGNVLTVLGEGAQEGVHEELRHLRHEIVHALDLPAEARRSLLGNVREIRELVGDAETLEQEMAHMAYEGLVREVTRFEVTHPKLAGAVKRLVRSLEGIGI